LALAEVDPVDVEQRVFDAEDIGELNAGVDRAEVGAAAVIDGQRLRRRLVANACGRSDRRGQRSAKPPEGVAPHATTPASGKRGKLRSGAGMVLAVL
jgi:hypothetical protein